MLELWLIRHGEPAYPRDALTPKGLRDARALGRYLRAQGLDGLYSSPMGRAVETARAVAEATGLSVKIEPWTAELETWAIQDPHRGEAPAWELDPIDARPRRIPMESWPTEGALKSAPSLEQSFDELVRRSDEFFARLGWQRRGAVYEASAGAAKGRYGVVCHCGFALTWLSHLLCFSPTWIWTSFTLAPTSITRVLLEPQQLRRKQPAERPMTVGVPRCHSLGATDFLFASEEEGTSHGSKTVVSEARP